MRLNPGRRTRISRAAVINCAVIIGAVIIGTVIIGTVIIGTVIVAAIGAPVITWRVGQHPTARPAASCGSAWTHRVDGETQLLGADRGALTCFSTAARGCRPASIRVIEMGVDTGTEYVFTVEPGGTSCQVTELSQFYSANFGGSRGPVTATSCRRTAVTGGGVALSCGGQDVLIPAEVSLR